MRRVRAKWARSQSRTRTIEITTENVSRIAHDLGIRSCQGRLTDPETGCQTPVTEGSASVTWGGYSCLPGAPGRQECPPHVTTHYLPIVLADVTASTPFPLGGVRTCQRPFFSQSKRCPPQRPVNDRRVFS